MYTSNYRIQSHIEVTHSVVQMLIQLVFLLYILRKNSRPLSFSSSQMTNPKSQLYLSDTILLLPYISFLRHWDEIGCTHVEVYLVNTWIILPMYDQI